MPLPSIVLLPLAMLWFGLGTNALIFRAAACRDLGRGDEHPCRLRRGVGNPAHGRAAITACLCPGYVIRILVPAAFPSILSGLKVGWAFAWRTLVAAELIFGTSARSGGLGWYIYTNKNELEITNVFAGLLDGDRHRTGSSIPSSSAVIETARPQEAGDAVALIPAHPAGSRNERPQGRRSGQIVRK